MTVAAPKPRQDPIWRDPAVDALTRARDLVSRMTLREKVAQLGCMWLGVDPSGQVAPHQDEMDTADSLDDTLAVGLGQLTRPLGTAPVDPVAGARSLETVQRAVMAANRFGLPALSHEECLAGFTAWQATCFPVPLAWGATFDPALVHEMATRIGTSMRAVGAHQGLAPVLDVTRDYRWGRTEETIGEDPYLVATTATAYVQGLESTGIVSTLKHFAGYSTTKAARNLAPASIGPRELADVILPPFEMAIIEGGARSVMNAYNDIDGIPVAANEALLTGLLRDTWDFAGTVVADYFSIGFLKLLHGVAATWGDAGRLALTAGIDVELPSVTGYGTALVEEVESGRLDESFVDRAALRVLAQKAELGLLDEDWDPTPPGLQDGDGRLDLDPPESRAVARRIAEESVVLLANDGLLPLRQAPASIAVIGPTADDPLAMFGCYAFPSHVGIDHPEVPLGIECRSVTEAVRAEFPGATVAFAQGCPVSEPDGSRIADAAALAAASDVVVLVLGDRAGLFGKGTSGEGCDAEDLTLPGAQAQLLEAVLDAGRPTVLVMLSGRPYALGSAPERAAAIVQTFFPGEEGGPATAGVLSGRVSPSGRLPVSIPAHAGSQPSTYLGAQLTHKSKVSVVDTTPAFPFGHGLSYAAAEWTEPTIGGRPAEATAGTPDEPSAVLRTDGQVDVGLTLVNPGDAPAVEVVQVYLHDPVASVVQPVQRLVGYARVDVPAGARRTVTFTVPADVASFTGASLKRIVEPGEIELRIARSSADVVTRAWVRLEGPTRVLGLDRRRRVDVSVR